MAKLRRRSGLGGTGLLLGAAALLALLFWPRKTIEAAPTGDAETEGLKVAIIPGAEGIGDLASAPTAKLAGYVQNTGNVDATYRVRLRAEVFDPAGVSMGIGEGVQETSALAGQRSAPLAMEKVVSVLPGYTLKAVGVLDLLAPRAQTAYKATNPAQYTVPVMVGAELVVTPSVTAEGTTATAPPTSPTPTAPSAPAASAGAIAGQYLFSGSPIAASIGLYSGSTYVATTVSAASGAFSFTNLAPGSYTLYGIGDVPQSVEVQAGATTSVVFYDATLPSF